MNDIERSIGSMLVTDLFVEIPEDRMTPDDRLRGDLGLDSLGFVELRVQCENTFGITISDAEFTRRTSPASAPSPTSFAPCGAAPRWPAIDVRTSRTPGSAERTHPCQPT
ncbi:acyl carrier protein [Kibdelosporangium philippinense]|uniref:acyl carrier protein n=1 Tax=Kibdelosporangium philippinense TaxID=211113 RepID=UPI0036064A6A